MNRLFALILAGILIFSLIPGAEQALAEEAYVSSYAELASAVASAGGDTHIVLQGGFVLEAGLTVPEGASVTLSAGTSDVTLSRSGYPGPMFTVPVSSSLAILGYGDRRIALRGSGASTVETAEPDSGILAEGRFRAEYVDVSYFCGSNGGAI